MSPVGLPPASCCGHKAQSVDKNLAHETQRPLYEMLTPMSHICVIDGGHKVGDKPSMDTNLSSARFRARVGYSGRCRDSAENMNTVSERISGTQLG